MVGQEGPRVGPPGASLTGLGEHRALASHSGLPPSLSGQAEGIGSLLGMPLRGPGCEDKTGLTVPWRLGQVGGRVSYVIGLAGASLSGSP